jgi:hypothetical protein
MFDRLSSARLAVKPLRETLNPGRLIAWIDFMGAIPHENVLQTMELFSSKVMPQI